MTALWVALAIACLPAGWYAGAAVSDWRQRRQMRRFIASFPPSRECLGDPHCAMMLGYQWCTCHSPAVTAMREARGRGIVQEEGAQ